MPGLGDSFHDFFFYFLGFASSSFPRRRLRPLAFRDVKKAVGKGLKRSGFKVSRRVLELSKMSRGKRVFVFVHDAKHSGLRFHVLSSIVDYEGRFRVRPVAYNVTVVYVERIGRGILRRLVSALKRNIYVSDTLAVSLLAVNPDHAPGCEPRHGDACYVCELMKVDYTKYEKSYGGSWFFFDPFITGIFSTHSVYHYEAGTEIEKKETTTITLDEVRELFNSLAETVQETPSQDTTLRTPRAEDDIIKPGTPSHTAKH